jgi:hypothetical protein
MDLADWPYVGVATIRMLHIPMEVVRIAAGWRRVRNPLVPFDVQVTILWTPRGFLQPIPVPRRYKGMRAGTRQVHPGIFCRPILADTHLLDFL